MPLHFFPKDQELGQNERCARPLPVRSHRLLLGDGAPGSAKVRAMNEKRFFDDLSERINEALRNSPAQDIEKNLRALLASWFDRMDLVMRDEFEVQKRLLEAAQTRLAALEARLAEIERRSGSSSR